MAQVKGVVQEITQREVSGGRTAYSLKIAGQSYGAGLYKPKCKEGDYVTFDVEENGQYKNVGRNSLKVSDYKPTAEESAPAASAPAAKASGGWDDRQDTISRQAASNTAIAFMQIMSDNEALGLPKSDAKGAKAKALIAILHRLEQEIYERNTGKTYVDISPKQKLEEAGDPESMEDEGAAPDDSWD